MFRPKNFYDYSPKHYWRRYFPAKNPEAVFLLGNQKSGTSAIAALLSMLTRKSLTLDIPWFDPDEQDQLHRRELAFDQYIQNRLPVFSRELIKEPALTFLYQDLREQFSEKQRWIFIVRDPRDNLRSILNRLETPGDLEHLDPSDEIPKAWQRVIWNDWLGCMASHYIESLAQRWNLACKIYTEDRDRLILVRYEDFVADKTGTLRNLADQFGWKPRARIDHALDRPYQPRGRPVPWLEFFGEQNLRTIETMCREAMGTFGYEPTL